MIMYHDILHILLASTNPFYCLDKDCIVLIESKSQFEWISRS